MSKPVVVLKLSPKVKNVITFAQSVATAMTNNPSFPSPNPPIATLLADIAALNTAEAAVLSRAKGSVETRDAKLEVVKNDLGTLRGYVQDVAQAALPANADAIIQSAGMTSRKVTLHDKPVLAVEQGSVSGTVTIAAKAVAKSATYLWQYSSDDKTWTNLPMTTKARTGLSGLTPATTYYFRFQAFTHSGLSDWSGVVTFLVK